MVPQYIGSYRVLRVLGEGGMATVLLAINEQIGRQAAIKMLHGHISRDEQSAARLFQEAQAANRIHHPGIVAIYEVGQLPDSAPYLVMEYLEGESLRTRLQRGHLAPEDALRLARQLASALAAAHAQCVVHRDLKPDNIMLVPDPEAPGGERAKILGFGLAKLTVALRDADPAFTTRAGAVLGTPAYMAPEQYRNAAEVTDLADVYALGVVLYQMLAGRAPFIAPPGGDAVLALLAMHLHEVPPSLAKAAPAVSQELVALVHRMLAKEPADRPTMSQVVTMLEALGAPRAGALPGRATTHQRWTRLSAVLLSYAGFSFSLLQCIDLLVNRYALSVEWVKLSFYALLLFVPLALLLGALWGEPRHSRLWRRRWIGVSACLVLFTTGMLWAVRSKGPARTSVAAPPPSLGPPVAPRPAATAPQFAVLTPNLSAYPCDVEGGDRGRSPNASIKTPSSALQTSGSCPRGFVAWCSEHQQQIACCTNGLVPFGQEGSCGCPPGGSTEPAALKVGCPKATQAEANPDKELIRAHIGQHIEAIRDCYQVDLNSNDRLQGRVMIKFVIAADGSVPSARIASASLPAPGAQRCMVDVFRTLKFLPPPNGFVMVTYPLILKSASE